jgi:pimeloyl-ACP methyl ester carboxylesterase
MTIFRNSAAEIYFEAKGSGPYLVLLAGLASDSQSWSTVMNKLAKHFTLIMPDNRGCGRTQCPVEDITIKNMAEDTIALMDHLEIEKTHLAGHSMGGYVAQQVCFDHPERIDKLILAATSAFTDKRNQALLNDLAKYLEDGMDPNEWFRALYFWIFTRKFFENERLLELSLDYSVNYPYPQTAGQFRKQVEALNGFDSSERLTEIKQKTLILCGNEDILFWPHESISALSAIPNFEVGVIENAAHSFFVEQPDAFVKGVVGFLNQE